MQRVIGAALVLLAGLLIGEGRVRAGKKHIRAITAMQLALQYLQNEICERRVPLPEIFEQLAAHQNLVVKQVFDALLQDFFTEPEQTLATLWCRVMDEQGRKIGLAAAEIELLCTLSDSLGRYEAEAQRLALRYCQNRLSESEGQAEARLLQNARLYRSLGLSLGVLLLIIGL